MRENRLSKIGIPSSLSAGMCWVMTIFGAFITFTIAVPNRNPQDRRALFIMLGLTILSFILAIRASVIRWLNEDLIAHEEEMEGAKRYIISWDPKDTSNGFLYAALRELAGVEIHSTGPDHVVLYMHPGRARHIQDTRPDLTIEEDVQHQPL